jgi:hypothetical protein
MSNFADGLFPEWLSFVMLLPFLMLGFGLLFIGRAFSDKGGARQEAEAKDEGQSRVVVSLPDRGQQPLYRVHQQIQASARPPPKAEPDEPSRASGGRPRRRRHHGTTTRLELRR